MATLGVDLGGSNIKVALVEGDGRILREISRPTNLPRPAEAICDDIVQLCRDLMQGNRVEGIGIGCPGTVDDSSGTVVYSNNLGWSNFGMRPYLEKYLGIPVHLANDANAAALGEVMAGCAKNADSAVILTLGTGVGGGVVLNGKLLTGYTGAAAEPGHMVVNDAKNAPLCTCGRRGCLEAYASATALIRMTRHAMELNPKSALWKVASLETVTGKTAFDGRDKGDAVATAVVDEYIHWLAIGVANLINIFFPKVVGLSGGIANQGDALLTPLRSQVEPLVFGNQFVQRKTELTLCTLGYRAGMIGAALLAKR